jgi:uncharacterized protein DUF3347
MKKFILLAVLFIAAGFLAYKLLSEKPVHHPSHEDPALQISKNSPVFNAAFDSVLNGYYALHDALVDWDTLRADRAAFSLAISTDSLPVRLIRGDSAVVLTAQSVAAMLSGEAKGFSGTPGIEARRQSFNTITEDLYNLVRAVHFDAATIYHIRCPMAFKDSIEGFWLNNTTKIVNPYLGNKHPIFKAKMITCGEVIDSFPQKK